MVSEGGLDPQLLGRLRQVVLELENQGSSEGESPATRFMGRVRVAVRAGDLVTVGRLVSEMESELRTAGEKAESTDLEPLFEEGDLGIPHPRPKGSAWSWPSRLKARIPRVGQALKGLKPSPLTRTRLLTSAVLGIAFALLLGLAANWRLLWGVDTPGIYTFQDFFYRPGVDVALPSLLSALDGSNLYATQYLTLGIEGVVAAYCIQLLTGALARGTFSGVAIVVAETLAAALYLANPYILTFGTTSLLSNVLISNSAFIAFLAILLKVIGDVCNGRPIARSTALFMGLAIGLSNPYAFPNLLRIQVMIVAALGLAFVYLLVVRIRSAAPSVPNRHPLRTTVLRFCVYSIPPALALVAYPIWSAWSTYIAPGGSLGSIISSQPALALSTFNTFPFVIRLLGKGTLHHFAYSALYSGISVESVASWEWPLLALGLPAVAVLVRRPRFLSWKLVAVMEVFGWVALAWSAGSNPPLGFAVSPVIRAYPRLLYAFPYYYSQYQILSVLYPVLASVSVLWVGLGTRDLLQWLVSGSGARASEPAEPAIASPVPTGKRVRSLGLPSIGSKLVGTRPGRSADLGSTARLRRSDSDIKRGTCTRGLRDSEGILDSSNRSPVFGGRHVVAPRSSSVRPDFLGLLRCFEFLYDIQLSEPGDPARLLRSFPDPQPRDQSELPEPDRTPRSRGHIELCKQFLHSPNSAKRLRRRPDHRVAHERGRARRFVGFCVDRPDANILQFELTSAGNRGWKCFDRNRIGQLHGRAPD